MASQLDSNPIRMEGAATVWTGEVRKVRLIQWVDDNADLVDNSTLVLSINGVALTVIIQIDADDVSLKGAVAWQIGPFSPGVPVSDFIVTTMGTGELHIWV